MSNKTDAPKRSFYIVFEGADYSGKTYHSQALQSYLSDRMSCVWTREPGSPLVPGLHLRELILSTKALDPTALELLLQADRAAHTAAIAEQRKNGTTVVSDRSFLSGLAYAHAKGHWSTTLQLNTLSVDPTAQYPDIIISVEAPLEELLERMKKSGQTWTREEIKGVGFIEKVLEGYQRVYKIYPPTIKVNTLDFKDKVQEFIRQRVDAIIDGLG